MGIVHCSSLIGKRGKAIRSQSGRGSIGWGRDASACTGDFMIEASIDAPASDELLVDRARKGDRSASGELFRRHWDVAYRVGTVLGTSRTRQDADAGVHDQGPLATWEIFARPKRFQTWLLKIMTNPASTRPEAETSAAPGSGLATAIPGTLSLPRSTTRPTTSDAATSGRPSTPPLSGSPQATPGSSCSPRRASAMTRSPRSRTSRFAPYEPDLLRNKTTNQ